MRSLRFSLCLLFALGFSACFRTNPSYCDRANPCGNGEYCDAMLHVCAKLGSSGSPDGGVGSGLTIKDVTPSRGSPDGGYPIRINGSGFKPDTKVIFNATELALDETSTSTQLVVTVPQGCGAALIEVRNADGSSAKLPGGFRYEYANLAFADVVKLAIPATYVPARSLVAGNFDGASKDGLAAVSLKGAAGNALFIKGAGTLVPSVTATAIPMTTAVHAIAANFTTDTSTDLVLYNEGNGGFIGGASGAVTPFVSVNAQALRARLAVTVDVDGDSVSDIIAVEEPTGALKLVPVQGAGTLAVPSAIPGITDTNVISLAAVDFDQLGTKELALISRNDDRLTIYRQTAGIWTREDQLFLGTGLKRVLASDVNGDGKMDLVVLNDTGLRVVLNDTTAGGTLKYVTNVQLTALPANTNSSVMDLSDLNCDGLPELITYQTVSNELRIYPNGSGSVASIFNTLSPVTIAFKEPLESFAIGLLDGDAKPDLAMLNATGDLLGRAINQSM